MKDICFPSLGSCENKDGNVPGIKHSCGCNQFVLVKRFDLRVFIKIQEIFLGTFGFS